MMKQPFFEGCVYVCVWGGTGGYLEVGVGGGRKEDRQTLQGIVAAALLDAPGFYKFHSTKHKTFTLCRC